MTIITKEKKKDIVEALSENIREQRAVFFVGFKGITGEKSYQLRKNLGEKEAKLFIVRKTLAKIAFEKEGMAFDPLTLKGEVGFVFSSEDAIGTAKAIRQFEKEETISFLGGIFEENILSAKEARNLSELPSREELLSRLVGTLSAPTGDFLRVLQGNIKGLLYVLANAKT